MTMEGNDPAHTRSNSILSGLAQPLVLESKHHPVIIHHVCEDPGDIRMNTKSSQSGRSRNHLGDIAILDSSDSILPKRKLVPRKGEVREPGSLPLVGSGEARPKLSSADSMLFLANY